MHLTFNPRFVWKTKLILDSWNCSTEKVILFDFIRWLWNRVLLELELDLWISKLNILSFDVSWQLRIFFIWTKQVGDCFVIKKLPKHNLKMPFWKENVKNLKACEDDLEDGRDGAYPYSTGCLNVYEVTPPKRPPPSSTLGRKSRPPTSPNEYCQCSLHAGKHFKHQAG